MKIPRESKAELIVPLAIMIVSLLIAVGVLFIIN
jgi:hypothetical protein